MERAASESLRDLHCFPSPSRSWRCQLRLGRTTCCPTRGIGIHRIDIQSVVHLSNTIIAEKGSSKHQ